MGFLELLADMGRYYGAAGSANATSWSSQYAQGQFNQNSANLANQLGTDRLQQMYAYNSAQARMADQSTWNFLNAQMQFNSLEAEKSRMFSEYMWNKAADYNSFEAALNRGWSEQMENTRYQRAVEDMKAAGINPILASGGISTGAGSGGAASMTGASSAQATAGLGQGHQASGSTMNGISANESSFTGQMDYYSGIFSLMGTAIESISSGIKGLGSLGDLGNELGEALAKVIGGDKPGTILGVPIEDPNPKTNKKGKYQYTNKGYWYNDHNIAR